MNEREQNCRLVLVVLLFVVWFLAACGGSGSNAAKSTPTDPRAAFFGVMWQGVQNGSMDCSWLDIFRDVPKPALSFLAVSYGVNNDCLAEFLADEREKVVNAYLSNGVCIRRRNCSDIELSTTGQIVAAARWVNHIFYLHCKNCRKILTIQLEDNLDEHTACLIADAVREAVPDAEVWRNPERAADIGSSYTCFDGIELHNSTDYSEGVATAWSNDGADLLLGNTIWANPSRVSRDDARRGARESGADIVYFWAADGNCLLTDSGAAPWPYKRDCSNRDSKTISDLNQLLLTTNGG